MNGDGCRPIFSVTFELQLVNLFSSSFEIYVDYCYILNGMREILLLNHIEELEVGLRWIYLTSVWQLR